MLGILSDVQQIIGIIQFLREMYDSNEGNKDLSNVLILRCLNLEEHVKKLKQSNENLAGIRLLKHAMVECRNFVAGYRQKGRLKQIWRYINSKNIETKFNELSHWLSKAACDLNFGIDVNTNLALGAFILDNKKNGAFLLEALEAMDIRSAAKEREIASELGRCYQLLELVDQKLDSASAGSPNSDVFLKSSFEKTFIKIDKSLLNQNNCKLLWNGSLSSVSTCLYDSKPCAIKRFENVASMTTMQLRLIKREASIMQLTRHENIIGFVGLDIDEGFILCDLAYCSLHDILYVEEYSKQLEQYDLHNIFVKLDWLIGAAKALRYLHFHGIIHRDIKPQNILLKNDVANKRLTVKVCDFGVSKASGISTFGCGSSSNHFIGTAPYMAPEVLDIQTIDSQIQALLYTPAVDIYSFGIMVNEVLCEKKPWVDQNEIQMHMVQIALGVLKGARPPLYSGETEVGKALTSIVGTSSSGCLATIPENRPNASKLVKSLMSALKLTSELPFEMVKFIADQTRDAESQCQVAVCYFMGKGSLKNENKQDVGLYHEILPHCSDINVELCCDFVIGTDFMKALEYFVEAARQNHPVAQFFMGYFFQAGKHFKVSIADAYQYYKLSADQGFAPAQYIVGSFYSSGFVESENSHDANRLYELSAKSGFAPAQFTVGNQYYLAGNRMEAFHMYQLSAKQGYSEAQYNVGVCFACGIGVVQNDSKAYEFFLLSANQDNKFAQYNLGNWYTNGRHIEPNDEEGFSWFLKSAIQGYSEAQFNVGVCYSSGIGVAPNSLLASKYFSMAATQGHSRTQHLSPNHF